MNLDGFETTQYAVSKGSPKGLHALTACLWMSTPASYAHTFLSHTSSYKVKGAPYGNSFTLEIHPDLTLYAENDVYRCE